MSVSQHPAAAEQQSAGVRSANSNTHKCRCQRKRQPVRSATTDASTRWPSQLQHQASHILCQGLSRPVQLAHAPITGQKGPLTFQGELRIPSEPRAAHNCIKDLLYLADSATFPVIAGYDTETRVVWRGNATIKSRTSLMQLCYHPAGSTQPICLLLPLSQLGLKKHACQLLSHPNIIKAGLGLAQDMHELQNDYSAAAATNIRSCLDLSWMAYACQVPKPLLPHMAELQAQKKQQGLKAFVPNEAWSLAGLLEHVSGYRMVKSKRIQRSNWARWPLTAQQVAYAATDAYAGLIIYHSLWLRWLQMQQPAATASQSLILGPTLELNKVTSAGFWAMHHPAMALHEQWQQQIFQPGFRAFTMQREHMAENTMYKADAADCQEWQLEHYTGDCGVGAQDDASIHKGRWC